MTSWSSMTFHLTRLSEHEMKLVYFCRLLLFCDRCVRSNCKSQIELDRTGVVSIYRDFTVWDV